MNGRMLEGEFEERVAKPIVGFVESLEGVQGIDGVALLKSSYPSVSDTLYIEVIGRFGEKKTGDEAVDAALGAEFTLAEALHGVLHSGLGFVDSSGITMDELEPKMRERWSEDPGIIPIQVIRFPL